MASEKRIYKVTATVNDATKIRLVEATNAAQAIKHVVRGTVECAPCSVADALALGASGVKVEKAGQEPAE